MPRPSHKPTPETRKLVAELAGYGVPLEQVAALVDDGIDYDTLKKHYQADIDKGKAKANSKVGKTLFQKTQDGDTAAMIWWTKSQMRWKGEERIEHTGADGGPLQLPPIVLIRPDEKPGG